MQHLDPETLSGYIDGELSADELEMAEAHLSSCHQCRQEFEELRGMSALVRDLPVYQPRKRMHIRRVAAPPEPMNTSVARFVRPLALAAIVILLAVTGFAIMSEITDPEPEEGDPIEFSQTDQDGTDDDRTASQSVADAPDLAQPDDEAAMTTLQEQQDAPESGQLASATDEPDDDPDSSLAYWVRIVIYVVMGVALTGAAVWLHYQRARRT